MKISTFLPPILFKLILLVFVSCSNKSSNENTHDLSPIKVGEKIPAYVFQNVLNSTVQSISTTEYENKPLLIELWATWCSPCLPAMEKLDSFQQEYQDDIEIITVSSEDRTRLEKYIRNTKIGLPIISDTNFYKAAPTRGIPSTILIDRNGIVKAITNPSNVNHEIIHQLIAGDSLTLLQEEKNVSNSIVLKELVDEDKRILLKSLEPSKRMGEQKLVNSEGDTNGLVYYNHSLPSLFQKLYEIPTYYRIIYKDSLKESDFSYNNTDNIYTFSIEVSPKLEDRIHETALEYMNNNFDVYAQKVIDSVECYVLTVADDRLKISSSEKEDYEFRGPELIAKKQEIKRLALYIEMINRVIVVDRTGLEGRYDFDLNWEFEKPETLHRELAKYGFVLKKSEIKLPAEVVEIHKKIQK